MASARRAARWAYERERIVDALARAVMIVPAGVAAWLAGATWTDSVTTSIALAALTAIGGWWRTELGRGAIAGASIIAIPMLLSMTMKVAGSAMTPSQCHVFCLYGAAVLGCGAGSTLGYATAQRSRADRLWFAGSAAATAAFAATIGCSALGFGSILGLGLGLTVTALPAYALGRATA